MEAVENLQVGDTSHGELQVLSGTQSQDTFEEQLYEQREVLCMKQMQRLRTWTCAGNHVCPGALGAVEQ